MLALPSRFERWLAKSGVQPAAIIEVVTSYLMQRLDTKADWEAGEQVETTPSTTLNANLNAGAGTATLVTADDFPIPAGSSWPNYFIVTDGAAFEVIKYTDGTNTTLTGLVRGQYGTTDANWLSGHTCFPLFRHSGFISEPYDLQVQPKNWTQPSFGTTKPSLREGAACVWDSVNNVMWMHGGHDGTNFLNDLWYFDPSAGTWTQVAYSNGPPAGRRYHAMTIDNSVSTPVIIVSGGQTAADWETTDFYRFIVLSPPNVTYSTMTSIPVAKKKHYMVFVPPNEIDTTGNGTIIVAGGASNTKANAWKTYSTPTYAISWTEKQALVSVTIGYNALLMGPGIWCTTQKRMLILGHLEGTTSTGHALYDPISDNWDATWYSGTTLKRLPTSMRTYAAGVYNPNTSKALIFGGVYNWGGFSAYDVHSDLWQLDIEVDLSPGSGDPWTQLADYREGRCHCSAVWDTQSEQMIMWGGSKDERVLIAPTYVDPAMFRYYWAETVSADYTFDMGEVPVNNGNWEFDFTQPSYPAGHAVSFNAEYSDTGTSGPWTDMGAVKDGDEITELHRYYQVRVAMGSDVDDTPRVQKIEARFDVISRFCMAKDAALGYAPLVQSMPNLGWEIDPVKGTSKGGKLTVALVDDEAHTARDVISGNSIYNKRVLAKIGFVKRGDDDYARTDDIETGFPEADYVDMFEGTVQDYTWDGKVLVLHVEETLTQLYKKEIPNDADGAQPTPITYSAAGITHPASIIRDVVRNKVNWPDRKLDIDSFDIAVADSSISGWQFYRVISKPMKAKKLLEELCRLIGANLIPGEDGRLRIKIYDQTEEPVAVITEQDIKPGSVQMEWNPDTVKNQVAVYYDIISGDGGETDDYTAAQVRIDADSVSRFDETFNERILAKWLGDVATYNGDTRADDIAARIIGRTAFGAAKMKIKTGLDFFKVQVGDIVRLKAAILGELGALIDEMNKVVPDPKAPSYLSFGAERCMDMKFQVVKKTVHMKDMTIDWVLWRAKYALDGDVNSQAEFDNGWGYQIDIEATPGSVQLENGETDGWYQVDIDLGQQPEEDGAWTLNDTTPGATTVTYEAWASDSGDFMGEETSIGAITTGASITTRKRYYRVKATLTGTSGPWVTPTVDRIRAYFNG